MGSDGPDTQHKIQILWEHEVYQGHPDLDPPTGVVWISIINASRPDGLLKLHPDHYAFKVLTEDWKWIQQKNPPRKQFGCLYCDT